MSLALSCLSELKQLKFNICDLPSSFLCDSEVPGLQETITERIGDTLAYSCNFWTYHLFHSKLAYGIVTKVKTFLERQGVFWIEAMNLLELLPRCGEILDDLAEVRFKISML